jgi:hypothetical protein
MVGTNTQGASVRILRFQSRDGGAYRYFVVSNEREVESVALKLLNEVRNLGTLEGAEKDFVEAIADEQDGDNALSYLTRRYNIRSINPEVV